ncbi:hypothetical protein [Rhodoplanes roseus]|uniref:Uncharacterized protein n=1 Tax=Rhodoplanes roseus TaxID=29409 RepID=A0A327L2E1_9BRAD|nr:hypothetical protein [Rhodoplanes roseus]RAI43983.1 hypothetical protein CH341_11435 [Rhodoplanes roseus]
MSNLTLTINGDLVELTPTLEAGLALSDKYNGLIPVVERLNFGQIEVAIDVLYWALPLSRQERFTTLPGRQVEAAAAKVLGGAFRIAPSSFSITREKAQELSDIVQDLGMTAVVPTLVRFTIALMNGGKVKESIAEAIEPAHV